MSYWSEAKEMREQLEEAESLIAVLYYLAKDALDEKCKQQTALLVTMDLILEYMDERMKK
jgi:hypothetical protein